MSWFGTRSLREKTLLLIMAVLAIVMGIYMIIIDPVRTAYKSAVKLHAQAENNLRIVNENAHALQASIPVSTRQGFDRTVLITIAQQYELPISRVQPDSNGDLQVWFDDIPSPSLFRFTADLERNYALRIMRLQVQRREDEKVNAQLKLSLQARS